MKAGWAAAAGVVVAALAANFLVAGPQNLADDAQANTYRGLSQRAFYLADAAHSRLRGEPAYLACRALDGQKGSDTCWARKDIQAEGKFYALTVNLVCPLIGFALFLALYRRRLGWGAWLALAVLLLAAVAPLPRYFFTGPELHATAVALAMISSVALLPDAKRRENAV